MANLLDRAVAETLGQASGLSDYQFVNADAGTQGNGYDCGIFSLMNIEKVVTQPNYMHQANAPLSQALMPLYRAKIINKLYAHNNLVARLV